MREEHFLDLCQQQYEENTKDDCEHEPYNFLDSLPVWYDEGVTSADDVKFLSEIIIKLSKKVGAQIMQEFEAVMTGSGDDKSPQMWHFDGVAANIAGVGVLPLRGERPVRGSTEIVKYQVHRHTQTHTCTHTHTDMHTDTHTN